MFIEFNDGFQSYSEGGGEPFLKENEPFEVSQAEGERLLALEGALMENGGRVKRPVFRQIEGRAAESLKKEKVSELTKKSKADLVAEATAKNIPVVPDSQTKEEIAEAIVEGE
jgi:hypothetical protein